jgi:cytochrome b
MAQGQTPKGGQSAPRPATARASGSGHEAPTGGPSEGASWDPLVRITHWAVAVAVLSNYLLNRAGGTWHVWIGWGLMAVLALRFAWGFVGPQEARFTSFLPNPFAALRHIGALLRKLGGTRDAMPEYPSHNPAGAVMIYALWALLALISITGLVMTGGASPVRLAEKQAIVETGDWSTLVPADKEADGEGEGAGGAWAKEVHEVAANLVVILALIHVGGVGLESRALGRNLVRPMLRKS